MDFVQTNLHYQGELDKDASRVMAKWLKLAWIPRLLSEEENSKDSWRAIPKYLPYKFGGLNYLTSFLQASIYPSSTKNSFSIFLELIKTTCNVIPHEEFALFNNSHIVEWMLYL